jgi:hypothetical protein
MPSQPCPGVFEWALRPPAQDPLEEPILYHALHKHRPAPAVRWMPPLSIAEAQARSLLH